jgi:RNA polymerase sigma-70 factor (ECF subfamily)
MENLIPNESLLIEKIKNGHEYAFEIAFLKYYESLCRYTWKYVRSKEQAKEIAQDVFADIWEKRDLLEPNGNLKGLLYTSARYKSLDFIKHTKVVECHLAEAKIEEKDRFYATMHHERLEHECLLKDIKEAIGDLPPKARTVYLLNREEGLTYKEIANHLSLSVKTVESRMSRGLRMLRSRLSHYSSIAILGFCRFLI